MLHSKYRPQPYLDVVSVGNTQVSPSVEIVLMCVDSVNVESAEKLVHALVKSRLDNCNAVLIGLPDSLIKTPGL